MKFNILINGSVSTRSRTPLSLCRSLDGISFYLVLFHKELKYEILQKIFGDWELIDSEIWDDFPLLQLYHYLDTYLTQTKFKLQIIISYFKFRKISGLEYLEHRINLCLWAEIHFFSRSLSHESPQILVKAYYPLNVHFLFKKNFMFHVLLLLSLDIIWVNQIFWVFLMLKNSLRNILWCVTLEWYLVWM